MEGKVKYSYSYGDINNGEWLNHKKHGKSIIKYAIGTKYEV